MNENKKKRDKKMGFFYSMSPGDPEYNRKMFNHMNGNPEIPEPPKGGSPKDMTSANGTSFSADGGNASAGTSASGGLGEAWISTGDYSDVPFVNSVNFINNKSNLMPGIPNIKKFIRALEDTGYDRFKTYRIGTNVCDADLSDEWLSLKRFGWSVKTVSDSSIKNGNRQEVYLCTKLNKTESAHTDKKLILSESLFKEDFNCD